MPHSRPKILIISSSNPCKGSGVIATDAYHAFREEGYEVDFLTLERCEAYPEFLYVRKRGFTLFNILIRLVELLRKWYAPLWARRNHCQAEPDNDYYFFYHDEKHPPVPAWMVLRKIRKQYDLVYIRFWQSMLSFSTVEKIQKKLQCRFIFDSVDYSPMTGGCHFTGSCERYQTGCGCCTAYHSTNENDFTHRNVLFRRRFYERVRPVVTGNSYMLSFYDKSYLLHDCKRIVSYPVIDVNTFIPCDQEEARREFGIAAGKRFVMLFGSQDIDDERKGIRYLIKAINQFGAQLTDEERAQVLVVAIGKGFDKIQPLLQVDSMSLGYVSLDVLPRVYSMADVFLCASVNDAGPMMVNQALCCGTPVVGFEMGVCIDAVKDRGTGYCARLKDADDLAHGISILFAQSPGERIAMRQRCRAFAEKTYSHHALVEKMMSAYQQSL